MLLLKGCPRCHGDLALDQDACTAFLYGVQCGHILSIVQETALRVHTTRHGLTHLAPQEPGSGIGSQVAHDTDVWPVAQQARRLKAVQGRSASPTVGS